LASGEDLTFARLAKAAGVPERTIYRHFPTRDALLVAVFDWANRRIGFTGDPPADAPSAMALVRKVFPGFDEIAPVIRELLVAPEGLRARLSDIEKRQVAAVSLVEQAVPGLDAVTARHLAAAVQLLSTAATWQALHDYWQMDGTEAGEAAALAIDLLIEGARVRAATLRTAT
jgi:AcrR family transcriptional regulator